MLGAERRRGGNGLINAKQMVLEYSCERTLSLGAVHEGLTDFGDLEDARGTDFIPVLAGERVDASM